LSAPLSDPFASTRTRNALCGISHDCGAGVADRSVGGQAGRFTRTAALGGRNAMASGKFVVSHLRPPRNRSGVVTGGDGAEICPCEARAGTSSLGRALGVGGQDFALAGAGAGTDCSEFPYSTGTARGGVSGATGASGAAWLSEVASAAAAKWAGQGSKRPANRSFCSPDPAPVRHALARCVNRPGTATSHEAMRVGLRLCRGQQGRSTEGPLPQALG
jgi:hypothetical protein